MKKIWMYVVCYILPVLLTMGAIVLLSYIDDKEIYSFLTSLIVGAYYIYIFYFIQNKLSYRHKLDMIMVPTIYIMMLLIVGILFSTILLSMNSFLNTGNYIPLFKYFYYCIISLTSVGYGDLSPGNDADRVVAIAMSLIGTLHMIIFISVIVSKLNLASPKS